MTDGSTPRAAAPRVLLIEDEPNILEAMRFVLSRDGWDVAVHGDGATAAPRAIRERPDVVVLDVMLPNVSGFDVLRVIRGAAAAMPILMLTARGQERDRELALSLGATGFMTKPFSNGALVEALRAMLDRAGAAPGPAERGVA